jgi:hypothetical protein
LENFTGARYFWAENSLMKRATLVVLGVLGFYFSASAQDTPGTGPALTLSRSEISSTAGSSLLLHSLPVMTFVDGQRLPASSGMGWLGMAPLVLSPDAPFSGAQVQKVNVNAAYRTDGKDSGRDSKDSPGEMISSLDRLYYGGEVGFLYGHSTGRFSGDLFETYMLGTVGNDKFQITVGTEYEDWSGHSPRFRSFAAPR